MVSPVHGHPVFVEEGRLKDQVPALFAHLVGAKAASLGLLAGTGERANVPSECKVCHRQIIARR